MAGKVSKNDIELEKILRKIDRKIYWLKKSKYIKKLEELKDQNKQEKISQNN
jgi:hypothetical protein